MAAAAGMRLALYAVTLDYIVLFQPHMDEGVDDISTGTGVHYQLVPIVQ